MCKFLYFFIALFCFYENFVFPMIDLPQLIQKRQNIGNKIIAFGGQIMTTNGEYTNEEVQAMDESYMIINKYKNAMETSFSLAQELFTIYTYMQYDRIGLLEEWEKK